MKALGIDIGSRTIKTVLLSDTAIVSREVVDATSRPSRVALELIANYRDLPIVATGYGRQLLEIEDIPSVTEIKACARGVRHICSDAHRIIDIGGQDLKVISLDSKGKVAKFEMNDRCAAGTGKFLEMMAEKLDIPIREFGNVALKGNGNVEISSLCTVFAESEVIGLLNRNVPVADIATAVHRSAVKKITAMFRRIADSSPHKIHLTGGGALNTSMRTMLADELGSEVEVPEHPQTVVALGAALIASER